MTIFKFFGWLLLAGSMGTGILLAILTRRLRAFRRADVPRWRYYLSSSSLDPDLYQGDGVRVVGQMWRVFGVMLASAVAGAVLLSFSQ